MAEPAYSLMEPSTVNLACFEVQGRPHAIEVAHVREIVRFMEITPLPGAPELIEGVIDLRGAVIPVLDLARVLGLGVGETGLRARIVVLETDGLVFGLWVEAATDVIGFDVAQMDDVPDLASHAGYDAVRHVVRRDGELPIMVLAPESLIENVYRSALVASPTAGSAAGDAR